ncbi:MAG: class I SAM-dependent methyltransferase [Candidatus Cloacimonetes bacterium]|nr:class I SAM-dependent methyltransferase [Candidatus Cloacimonadota bacterium]
MGRDKPDSGLVRAFEVYQVPKGEAIDLGCGHGRNTVLMAEFCQPTTGYELRDDFRGEAEEIMRANGVTFEFKFANVLELDFPPKTLAVVGVGMTIYNPKDMVEDLLRKGYGWLMHGGILHVEFATYRDASLESDFITRGCWEVAPGSFVHYCESYTCYAYGRNGGSFWEESEADGLIESLGSLKIVHQETVEWVHAQESDNGEKEEYQRSFYVVTAQKS